MAGVGTPISSDFDKDVMEDDEKKHRDVYALLTGALLGVPKDSFKWVLTWTTQHRATEIVEFFSAK